MEEHLDEEIIAYKKKEKKSQYASLETGFYIDNEILVFQEIALLDEKLHITLPANFNDMEADMMNFKYPSQQRPQIIKTNPEGSINFAFNYLDIPLLAEQTIMAVEQFRVMIRKVQPANIFFDLKEESTADITISWFDYKSYCIDEQMYNVLYVTPINGKMLQGIFNCPFGAQEEWKPVVLQIMLSIQDMTKKKGVRK